MIGAPASSAFRQAFDLQRRQGGEADASGARNGGDLAATTPGVDTAV
jgi:hypothetical protein